MIQKGGKDWLSNEEIYQDVQCKVAFMTSTRGWNKLFDKEMPWKVWYRVTFVVKVLIEKKS